LRIGVTLPHMGTVARQPREVARFARQAEQLGVDSLWVGDRLLAPVNPIVGYGGTDTIPEAFHSLLDPFVVMSIAAVSTEHVQIGTNVLNAPWYQPAVLARSLTSIDLVSDGRLLLGFGVGWSPDEYAAAGVPWNQRGARLDETLDALESYWTDNPSEFHGKYVTVPATYADLKPAQRPRPPIYLGGYSPAAMRRAARRADGWLPVIRPGRPSPWEFNADQINGPIEVIRGIAVEQGRDPAELGFVLRVYPTEDASVDQIASALIGAQQHTAVEHAFVDLMEVAGDVDHALELTSRILEQARNA